MKKQKTEVIIESVPLKAITGPLLNWYGQNARVLPWRSDPKPYRVWVSEIMLQQTRVEAVKPYFARFMEQLPSVEALSAASDEQIMKLWEGLGYYSRVRNMRRAAQMIVECYGGELPADYQALLKLPGIGSYTAGAIASIAYHIPVPAVDGNVLRVIMRVLSCRENIDLPPVKRAVEQALLKIMPTDVPGDFNQALMELGATVCLPNGAPRCETCPLSALCRAREQKTIDSLPVRSEKKKRRVEDKTVFLLIRESPDGVLQAALRKRPQTGLLAGLWEFPHMEGLYDENELSKLLEPWGVVPLNLMEKRTAKHIFTHIEWHMTGYILKVQSTPFCPFVWADSTALLKDHAVPSAFSAFQGALSGYLAPPKD